jgi:hypothetical protein
MVASVPPPPRDRKSTFQNNLGSIEFFCLASATCIIASKKVAAARRFSSGAARAACCLEHGRPPFALDW